MRKFLKWTRLMFIILAIAIIISIFTYMGKEVEKSFNGDMGLDTTTSTMTPEEEAEYYNHDIYKNHIKESQEALKTLITTAGTIAVIAIIIVVVIAKKKKSRG